MLKLTKQFYDVFVILQYPVVEAVVRREGGSEHLIDRIEKYWESKTD